MKDIFEIELKQGDMVIKTSSNYASAPILEPAIYIKNCLYSLRENSLIRKNSYNFFKLSKDEVLNNPNLSTKYKEILDATFKYQLDKPMKINIGTKLIIIPNKETTFGVCYDIQQLHYEIVEVVSINDTETYSIEDKHGVRHCCTNENCIVIS